MTRMRAPENVIAMLRHINDTKMLEDGEDKQAGEKPAATEEQVVAEELQAEEKKHD